MNYTSGYKTDVFLSYGQIDNQTEWVTAFHRKLNERLSVVLGSPVSVWRDTTRMDGLDPIWSTVETWATSCAMLVTILSPRYIRSESCRREVDFFVDSISRRRSQVPLVSRIVRVVKFPYDTTAAPINLPKDETAGYSFYETRADGTYREFLPDTNTFGDQIDRVAQAMANRLKLIRQETDQSSVGSGRHSARRKIFIADTTSDRKLDRDVLTNELGRDHDVLSVPDNLRTAAAIEAETTQLLAQADYSIHILGNRYGTVPEGTELSTVELEYRTVLTHRPDAKFRQCVFVPDNLEIAEVRQKSFTDMLLLQAPDLWSDRTELVRGGNTDLLEAVKDMIAHDAQVLVKPVKARSIYVMGTKHDLSEQALRTFRAHLFERGYANDTPAFEAGYLDLAEVEKQLILGSSGTVIYYGSAPDAWVLVKRRALIK